MATQTVHIKFNGRSGKLDIHTNGFVGEACTELTESVKSDLGAITLSEERTPEAFIQSPELENTQHQEAQH